MYYKFWFRAVDVRFKMLVFRSVVWATLLSGLVSFCISDRVFFFLDSFLLDEVRRMMRGDATVKSEKDGEQSINVNQLLNYGDFLDYQILVPNC